MIDTHCHVHDREFDDDREAVIARAREAGVGAMIAIGETIANSRIAIDVARRYGIAAAVGIHPHEAIDAPADVAAGLAPLLENDGVVAIGETGLDYYYDHSPREVQRSVLRAQLRLARERALPVVFHQRDAFDDFIAILREEWTPQMRGVVHCFTGDAAQAQTCTREFGLLLGIGGVVTFKKADALREAVRAVGIHAIVLETDCPYLAPVPMRGKRNEPSFLTHTANAVAEVLGAGAAEIETATDLNARALFSI